MIISILCCVSKNKYLRGQATCCISKTMSIDELKKKKVRTKEERKAASDRLHAKRREAEELGKRDDEEREKKREKSLGKSPFPHAHNINGTVGRPSIFSRELAEKVLREIEDGTTFKQFDQRADLPRSATVLRWYFENWEGWFSAAYDNAQKTRLYKMAHETLDIADDSQGDMACDEYGNVKQNHEYVARSKLRIDTRKWLASKLLHNIFGEKLEVVGKGDTAIVPTVNINVKKIEE